MEEYWISFSVAKPLLIITTLTLPNVQHMRRTYWHSFFVESESYSYTHPHNTQICEVCVTINLLKLKLPIHAHLIRMGLNFSDLRGTGVSEQSYLFLRVIVLLLVWCFFWGGGRGNMRKVAINQIICFHSKTVLLVW